MAFVGEAMKDMLKKQFSNKVNNSLLAVRDINHKYIVVERKRFII